VPHQWVRSRYDDDDDEDEDEDGARNCETMKMFPWIKAAGVVMGAWDLMTTMTTGDDDENDRVVAINRV